MKKQSVKRRIWHIVRRRKRQRGSAFPLAALAAPILENLGGVVFLKKKLEVKVDNHDDGEDMVTYRILLRIRVNPKRVNLTDEHITLDTKE